MRQYISNEKYELIKDNLDSKDTYVVVDGENVDKVAFITNNITGQNVKYEITPGAEPEPLKVVYWSYNGKIMLADDPAREHTMVKPTIESVAYSKLLISFKFNKDIDETTVNKDNFIVAPNGEAAPGWNYDLTYPTSDTVLLAINFFSKEDDPYYDGYSLTFNDTFLTDIAGQLYIAPIVISNNEPATYNDIPSYNYKVPATINYDKTNIDKLHISFVTSAEWIPIRTNIVNDWVLVDVDGVFPDIPASAVYKLNNVICLEFDMTDIPLGLHNVAVNWRGEGAYEFTITMNEPE